MKANQTKKILGTVKIAMILLIAGIISGCNEKSAPSNQVQESLTPQEYFANRIHMESGQPSVEIVPELYDELDFQRAVQAYIWATPFVSMSAMLNSQDKQFGSTLTRQPVFEQSVTPELEVLTGNNTTIYSFGPLDLTNGPVVMETPPGVLGGIDNHWMYPLTDIGPFGPDKAKGGKYLILPPGYEGDIPDGYFVVHSDTYKNFFLLRAIPKKGDNSGAVATIRKARLYLLSDVTNPPEMAWFNASGKKASVTFPTDARYFDILAKNLTEEPARMQDKTMLGMLAPLGIVHGQPFNPDERMRGILKRAAKVGNAMSRTIAYNSRNPNRIYAEGSQWEFVFLTKSATFDTDTYTDIDARVTFSHQAFFTAEGMVVKLVGKGSQYLGGYKDSEGNWLDGGQSYSLHIDPNVPMEDFWSVMVYDSETRSMILNDQRPGLDSNAKLKTNEDGSVDLYFGPTEPEGMESNWVKTNPDKGFFLYFRLYGPKKEFFDRSWKLNNLKKM